MLSFLSGWLDATWGMLVDSAPYFLLGLILAGLIWLFLNEKNLVRLMGNSRGQAVWRAALLGVPLPLCSCSVLPVADQLRQSGLSKGGTVSFLISTPESSADSILLTYSLTDPLLTVARPIAAFLSAAVAGYTENAFDHDSPAENLRPTVETCADGCHCAVPQNNDGPLLTRLVAGLKHSFTTLIGDLAPYLFAGYLLAGLAALLFVDYLHNPAAHIAGTWWPYVGALVIGLPLYICASSSTPLAAVLLGAGFPPGAILVFLMVGPATNLATLSVVKKVMGLVSTVRYLISIVAVSLICGLALDWLYGALSVTPRYAQGTAPETLGWLGAVSAVILTSLILWYSGRWAVKKLA